MSQPPSKTSLSLSARLFCYLGPPAAILLTSIASPQTALLSPLAFIPSALCFRYWKKNNNVDSSRRGDLEPLIWTYASVGTIGLVGAAVTQLAICYAAATLLFGSGESRTNFFNELQLGTIADLTVDELTRRATLAASWQNWIFNGIFTFIAAGLVEEALKCLPIVYARRRGTPKSRKPRDRAYIDYALAGALSFGVVECIGSIYGACIDGQKTLPKILLTLFERVVIGSFGHLLLGFSTALRAIRKDYCGEDMSWWSVVVPSVISHGVFNFVAISCSALEGNVGWTHPTSTKILAAMFGVLVGVVGLTIWQVRQDWMLLNEHDAKQK
jgi:RsiW-degrading membrane proteinase PrsW (M82 family)